MPGIVFGSDWPDGESESFYVVVSKHITSKAALFDELYNALNFPGYFGFNWDALSDCLCDLNWISSYNIVIIHEIVPDLPTADLKIYLHILLEAIGLWTENNEHSLEVRFKRTDENVVRPLLSQ